MSITKILKYELFFKHSQIVLFRIFVMVLTSSRQLKNICVLFEFRNKKYKEFIQATRDPGCAIAEYVEELNENYQNLSLKLLLFEETKCYALFEKP